MSSYFTLLISNLHQKHGISINTILSVKCLHYELCVWYIVTIVGIHHPANECPPIDFHDSYDELQLEYISQGHYYHLLHSCGSPLQALCPQYKTATMRVHPSHIFRTFNESTVGIMYNIGIKQKKFLNAIVEMFSLVATLIRLN